MKKLYVLLIVAVLGCASPPKETNDELSKWQAQAESVTIVRDSFGVPHIYGKTDADAVFGLLYAQCEDDFNRVEMNYINAMGRLAETEGEAELYRDLRMKLFIDPEDMKTKYEASPEWLKKLMDAFADGVNYYLHTHPEVKPKVIDRFEPWMALTFSEGSIGGDIERVRTSDLEQFYGEGTKEIALSEETWALQELEKEPTGSNGISIAPKLTKNGNTLFLINPHTSFFFRAEVHVVSEEGLNAYGAVTWGQFFVYQGFNERLGWMHTSSRADAIDYYLETVTEKEDGIYYKYGDEERKMMETKLALPYKTETGMAKKEVTAYHSHHGPIIKEQGGQWISIKLMQEPVKALTQSYLRTKAMNHDEFYETMRIRTNSSNNTVYADADGVIGYYHGNYIPKRDTAFDWSQPVDGSNPATEWQGLHTLEEMVTSFNPETGWLQNCNATPFTVAGYEHSPKREDYPTYMAPDLENFRGLHAMKVLDGQTNFTTEKLMEAAYDTYLTGFEKFVPALVKAYETSASGEAKNQLKEAIDLLGKWDLRYSLESVETSLAVYSGQNLIRTAFSDPNRGGASVYEYFLTGTTDQQKLEALQQAISTLEEDFGSWKTPWGEINRYQRLNGDIRQPFNDDEPSLPVDFASGRWGSLASFGSRTYPGTKKMYGTGGNSFVAFVEFGEKVKAKSILTGGQSGDPASPHFDDQAEMYTKAQFKDVRFYRDDVEKNAERTYHPGK